MTSLSVKDLVCFSDGTGSPVGSNGLHQKYGPIMMGNWCSHVMIHDIPDLTEPTRGDDKYQPPNVPDTPEGVTEGDNLFANDLASWNAKWKTAKNIFGHYVQTRSWDVSGQANFYGNVVTAPTQQVATEPDGSGGSWLNNFVGLQVNNATIARNSAYGVYLLQNTGGDVEAYSVYASGTAPGRFNGGVNTNTITSAQAADNDAEINFQPPHVALYAQDDNGRVVFDKRNSSNDTNKTITQTAGYWNLGGTFGGGYEWKSLNASYATDWWPEEGARNGWAFETVYVGNTAYPDYRAIVGSSLFSHGPQTQGRLLTYPPVPAGTRFNEDDMTEVLTWDHYQGHLALQNIPSGNANLYVNGKALYAAHFVQQFGTGLGDYPQLKQAFKRTLVEANVGNKYVDATTKNVYQIVVNDDYAPDKEEPAAPPRPQQPNRSDYEEGTDGDAAYDQAVIDYNQAMADYPAAYSDYKEEHELWEENLLQYKYALVDLSEKNESGLFVHQMPYSTTTCAVNAQATLGMDAHPSSTVCTYYANSPRIATAPQTNDGWTFGSYASYFANGLNKDTEPKSPMSKTWSACFATNQNAIATEVNVYAFYSIGSAPSRFNGEINCDTYTTADGADTDAKIELGASATISTGGQTRATFGDGGQLLKLADSTGFTQAVQYGLIVNPSVPASCTNSFFSFRSSPNLTTKTATLYHVCAYNRDGVGEQYGFYYGVTTSTPEKVGNVGFRANNLNADFAFYADQPSVPSLFKGDIRCNTFTGTSGTGPQISLADSQIKLFGSGGSEYQSTTDNSATTKKYVDSRIWKGTQAEFDNIGAGNYDDDVLYCITD